MSEDNIRITLVGDMMYGRYTIEEDRSSMSSKLNNIKSKKFSSNSMRTLYGGIYDYINENVDIFCGNLETPVTSNQKRHNKTYNFRLDEEYARVLKFDCKQVYNIANNHIMDYGEDGLLDTITNLDKLGIQHVGAGKDINDAVKEKIIQIDDVRFGFLGASDQMIGWKATKNNPGINILEYNDTKPLLEKIKNLKEECNIIILNLHWGENWSNTPTLKQQQFAEDAINAGVNVICGTSSHFPHNVKVNDKNNVIVYGMGDFIDDYAVNKYYRNDIGLMLNLDFVDKGDRIQINSPILQFVKIQNESTDLVKNPLEGIYGLRFLNT